METWQGWTLNHWLTLARLVTGFAYSLPDSVTLKPFYTLSIAIKPILAKLFSIAMAAVTSTGFFNSSHHYLWSSTKIGKEGGHTSILCSLAWIPFTATI